MISKTLKQPNPSQKLRVLIVDDSRMQRKLVAVHLKKWGFEIYEAESGDAALKLANEADLDMILSDWVMPGMSGPEFCQAFRAIHREHYVYFILLTSKSEKGDIAEGLEKGADDFLSKPVNPTELRARIKAGERILEMESALQKQNAKTQDALDQIRAINAEMDKDLKRAAILQQSLLPPSELHTQYYSIYNMLKSSGHVGGDLVGTFPISDTRRAVYSIDVSGHGVSSALLTVQLHGMLPPFQKDKNIAFKPDGKGGYEIRSPSEIATHFNNHLNSKEENELYFTLAYADVNLLSGEVDMVQAGHPHPVLFSPTGVRRLGEGGPPIGLIPEIEFEEFRFKMKRGEKLLLYSDGLTECQNPDGELLDDDGLETMLQPYLNQTGLELLEDIVWKLTEFAEDDDFGDDLSAILFELLENEDGS